MAAGSGWTAGADTRITNTVVGASGGYVSPTTNGMYCALYSTQFTAAAKSGATEYTTTGYSTYARQQMGATSPFGWTINAYASGTGVLWTNTSTITFPAVPVGGTTQTFFALGWVDVVTLGSGNINFFIDSASSVSQPVGVSVLLSAYSGAGTGAAFTTY